MPGDSSFHAFRAARDELLACAGDHPRAYAGFRWPRMETFNWATDWFDHIARDNHGVALRVVRAGGEQHATFDQLAHRSAQVAAWLRGQGVARGDRVLLLMENRRELWELQLALIRLRAVMVPLFTTLSRAQLAGFLARSGARHVIADTVPDLPLPDGVRVTLGRPAQGWLSYQDSASHPELLWGDGPTPADETLFYFFTSGTTSRPKLVVHSHTSYPVGHLSSMYLHGLRPGDVHVNVAAPGWAKHPWSSFFAPWNAEATIVSMDRASATPEGIMRALERYEATSFCAPPSVWRALIRAGTGGHAIRLRQALSVGEPLTTDIVDHIKGEWGVVVRNGYGQSEVTAMAGVLDGGTDDPTSFGRTLPGYRLVLLAPGTDTPAAEGEICVDLSDRPAAIMTGYLDETGPLASVGRGAYYRTGDLGRWEPDGSLRFLGRIKDAFVGDGGQRVLPVELERRVIRHPAVAEVAVVPVPDGSAPVAKAYVGLAEGWSAGPATAQAIFSDPGVGAHVHGLELIEFIDVFPRTESGKVHRERLRGYLRSGGLEFRPSPEATT